MVPVFRGSMRRREWVLPSGKIAITPPLSSTARHAAKEPALSTAPPPWSLRRCRGTAPTERRSAPKPGMRKSPSRAQKHTWRSSRVPRRSGSMMELGWLQARMVGSEASTRSRPVTSMVR